MSQQMAHLRPEHPECQKLKDMASRILQEKSHSPTNVDDVFYTVVGITTNQILANPRNASNSGVTITLCEEPFSSMEIEIVVRVVGNFKTFSVIRPHSHESQLAFMIANNYDGAVMITDEECMNAAVNYVIEMFADIRIFVDQIRVFKCDEIITDLYDYQYLIPSGHYVMISDYKYEYGFRNANTDGYADEYAIITSEIHRGSAELFIGAICATTVGNSLRITPRGSATKAASDY